METVLVLSVLCVFAQAAPQVSVVSSPALVAAPVNPYAIPLPLLAQVEGEAPASTVHASHVKQVIVPQVVSFGVPTHLVAAPAHVVHGAPAQIVSAYSLPAPIVNH